MDKAAKSKGEATSDGDPSESKDVVLLHAPTEDNAGYRAVRAREGRLELAEIRPAKEGQPLSGELVRLRPRPEFPLLCDVEVLFRPQDAGDGDAVGRGAGDGAAEPAADTGHGGPPRVSSRSYRKNWDEVFRPRRGKPRDPAN